MKVFVSVIASLLLGLAGGWSLGFVQGKTFSDRREYVAAATDLRISLEEEYPEELTEYLKAKYYSLRSLLGAKALDEAKDFGPVDSQRIDKLVVMKEPGMVVYFSEKATVGRATED